MNVISCVLQQNCEEAKYLSPPVAHSNISTASCSFVLEHDKCIIPKLRILKYLTRIKCVKQKTNPNQIKKCTTSLRFSALVVFVLGVHQCSTDLVCRSIIF